ncbi:uncharacterized protein LOC119355699 [Triticum dicoccoides]|uniref:uncharacterized protein LOC119355699 n=1 Tax=Triticum dicoccoides TaxID=85692 RepID=UPI00188DCC9E|nr:uncharacterized protein LOC119355699 [Triticum dicoccoides]
MYWPALKPSPARKKPAPEATTAASSALRDLEEETDDGWIVLPPAPPNSGKPPRPPPPRATATDAVNASPDEAFDPALDAIVARYLPLRRALLCDGLPRQIHDADVYGAHPGFLAAVYPPANGRPEWFFFVCRAQCQGGRRRAGPGAYRLGSEARLLGGAAYCHAFRYYEDEAEVGSASTRETEWRMDEYGDCRSAAAAFDMVVCKLYPARGGVVHTMLGVHQPASPAHHQDMNKPQVLVQLYLDSLNLGDPQRCRLYAVPDVFAAHPAVLTVAFPAANDRCEWFFAAHRRRRELEENDEDKARPRRAGPGAYVPVREGRVVNGNGGDIGYRRVFLYREDDVTVRRVSRTEWWMEEYGFGKDFPHGELPAAKAPMDEDEELVVYKLCLKMLGYRR